MLLLCLFLMLCARYVAPIRLTAVEVELLGHGAPPRPRPNFPVRPRALTPCDVTFSRVHPSLAGESPAPSPLRGSLTYCVVYTRPLETPVCSTDMLERGGLRSPRLLWREVPGVRRVRVYLLMVLIKHGPSLHHLHCLNIHSNSSITGFPIFL